MLACENPWVKASRPELWLSRRPVDFRTELPHGPDPCVVKLESLAATDESRCSTRVRRIAACTARSQKPGSLTKSGPTNGDRSQPARAAYGSGFLAQPPQPAAQNAVGGSVEFAGSLGTQVVKVFDLAVARTGLRDVGAREGGFDPMTVESEEWDHKVYYPDARRLQIRVTGDRRTGRLLGAQIVGDGRGQVAQRIDIFAAAMFAELAVADLVAMDLSYTPPLGPPWMLSRQRQMPGWPPSDPEPPARTRTQ